MKYMASRPGVDKVDNSKQHQPALEAQQKLISQILKDFPNTKELFEYKDFEAIPTIGNASEFITQALEQNLDRVAKRENYVDYISKRPRAERVGSHGLFTDNGQAVVLSQVAKEVAEHHGNVWLPIISLRREDASRLGYDEGKAWRALLRSQATAIADALKIKRDHFRWYASFHNESNHPHCHMVCYSTKPGEGYLTQQGIETMKAELAKQIFRQDLLGIYAEQTERRDALTTGSTEVMKELCAQVQAGVAVHQQAADLLMKLSERLKHTGGKKVYGYLPPDIRKLVDTVVDELSKDKRIADMYDLWYEKRFDVLRTYTDTMPDKIPLSHQKEFKSIRNMVIREALALGFIRLHPNETIPPLPVDDDTQPEDVAKDVVKALELLTASAEQGNPFAQYTLGKLYFMGQEIERDEEKAITYFTAAAAQGNEYAVFYLEHIPLWKQQAVSNAVMRLTKNLAQLMKEDDCGRYASHRHADRKVLSKEARKKEALGMKIS